MKVMCYALTDGEGLKLLYPSLSVKSQIEKLVRGAHEKFNGYIVAELKKPYNSRSSNQNRYFWAIAQQIAEDTGCDLDDIEEEVKTRAIVRGYPYEINKLNGKPKPYSMTKVSTVEMGYLIDEIQQLAAELGIVIEPRVSGEYAIFR